MSMSAMYATRTALEAIPKTSSQSSRYICRRCRHSSKPNITIIQRRRYASGNEGNKTVLEKVRGMMWKGEPPGPKNIDDVYGGPGFIQTVREERKKKAAAKKEDPSMVERVSQRIDDKMGDVEREQQELEQENKRLSMRQDNVEGQSSAIDAHLEALPEDYPEDVSKLAWTAAMPDPDDAHIVSLTSMEGLEDIGHRGELELLPEREEDKYEPYLVSVQSADITLTELAQVWQTTIKSKAEGPLNLDNPQARKMVQKFAKAISFRVPDSLLNTHRHAADKSISAFLSLVHEGLMPKLKLADQLLSDETLATNPNLLIINRRETLIDKETDLGRWKIIESELKSRGIPLTRGTS